MEELDSELPDSRRVSLLAWQRELLALKDDFLKDHWGEIRREEH